MNKVISHDDLVSQLSDGMTIGIGGWGARRKPMSLIRAICNSDLQDLTIVSYGGPDVGLLCAHKKIKKLIFGFVSLDMIPLEAHFRQARQNGELELMELDEGMVQWGLRAAAMKMSFLPTRVGMGTDVLKYNPEIKFITSPYSDGEQYVAMPALNLDAALLHVNTSDHKGNTQIEGPDPFFDEMFARAAAKTYVSSEQVVDTSELGGKEGAIFNRFERSLVSGVIHAPGGAHPTSCAPNYGFDMAHLKEYSAAAKSFDGYSTNYLNLSHEEYIEAVGGQNFINDIPLPQF
ncbi:acyl CoA--acetate/3-ketoacid CoA transferase subunit alpha [Gammaproteobacteria bacterium]|nr:acyl CoA--acetate/3-ketoacid CoA transferase subunit alpha [Gammaproteobacteria bacterium]MDA8720181.1 acyl CoA--acetate/3-ketoacid CoA transferase subunit alpha [bacterium]MDA8924524.1 acyl CoA--acetate/3-ketoacid CoA transferase subunit alpha [Gammaproteobacteria bacterium]MDA9049125.1 acyl CoA--acetate/3-ketoacid CoA transferase subunit alpha [Gammaproteobacteria bacterium]MDA9154051.1 acyl CoA--acetate/3-ketoacid CoA transferase subunit alpha [Gammaproteobacteria bacterium]